MSSRCRVGIWGWEGPLPRPFASLKGDGGWQTGSGEETYETPAQGLVVAPVVVVADEGCDSRLEVGGQLIGHLVYVALDSLVLALQLPVGLRVVEPNG